MCAQLSMPGAVSPNTMLIPTSTSRPTRVLPAEVSHDPAVGDEVGRERADYAEDRPACPNPNPCRVKRKACDTAEQAGQHIDQGEPRVTVRPLHDLPEDEQRQAVGQDVHDPGVEEHRREQAPVLSVDYERCGQRAEVDEVLRIRRSAADLQRDPQQEV